MTETTQESAGAAWALAEQQAQANEPEAQKRARTQAEQSNWPLSSAAQNQLLTFMTKALHATSVISVGTGSVLEALALAAGLDDNGQLTAVDSSARGITAIREQIGKINARPDDLQGGEDDSEKRQKHITLRAVNADPSVFLPRLNPSSYDLIVVSGDKDNYLPTFKQASYLLKDRGFIIFTDIIGSGVSTPDNTKPAIMRNLMESVEASDDFTSVLTATGTGLLIATRI
ncbi:O-methyltransferase [Bifidobacterium bombi]|uniref:O-methyltransferase, family 3 n=1 Tax=Bifidobacterium bombi DSM 19703 TaxID=1341695 RepID=A0A080N3X5_9BIFI|nr:hypothetical protein [Bifidobacterium bombi]KFF30870.1 O-methyltransferase, family 3 [Bifidobacterium bombi DSM 19703]